MKKWLERLFVAVFWVGIPLFLGIQYYNDPESSLINKALYLKPCEGVISYKIGQLDSQFGLTKKQAEVSVEKAARIWNTAYERKLFAENDQGTLSINFIYDERQKLRTQVDTQKDQVDQTQSTLESKIADYQLRVENYKRRAAQLNSEIDSWNSKGGAPTKIYNDLVKRINSLNSEATSLNREADSLNAQSLGLGKSVEKLNTTVTDFNSLIGTMPEEGLYDPAQNSIFIYVFTSQNELISTLAHEFGHALNMDHVKDQNAIMYAYANSNLKPTTEDLAELAKVCQPQNRFELWYNFLKVKISQL